jgi:hypothetical protein
MTIIGVTVLSPFNYQYGNRTVYVECGDRLHFDISKPEEKRELEFLVRPFSDYEGMVFIDKSYPGVAELLEEVNGKKDYEPSYLEKEAVKQPLILTEIPYGTEGYPALDPDMEVTPDKQVGGVLLAELEVPNVADNSRDLRLKELENSSIKTIKELVSDIGVEYKNKLQAINAIIEKEYGVE